MPSKSRGTQLPKTNPVTHKPNIVEPTENTPQAASENSATSLLITIAADTVYFAQDAAYILWEYFPNFQEVAINTFLTTTVEMALEPLLPIAGNQAVKDTFRDIAKIPGTLTSMFYDVNYGNSEYKYDTANVVAQFVKVGCKVTLVGGAYYLSGQSLPATITMARFANTLCEIPARTLIEVGRLKQKENDTTTPFYEYYADHIDKTIIVGAISSSFAKKTIGTIAGELLGAYVPSHKFAKTTSLQFDTWLLEKAGGTNNANIGTHTDTYFTIIGNVYNALNVATLSIKAAVLSLATAGEFSLREASNVFSTYSIVFLARAAQEYGSEVAEEHIIPYCVATYNYLSTLTVDTELSGSDASNKGEL